jgi:hypothetical protein
VQFGPKGLICSKTILIKTTPYKSTIQFHPDLIQASVGSEMVVFMALTVIKKGNVIPINFLSLDSFDVKTVS